MKQILINVSDCYDPAEHCREVARLIDDGYCHGIVGATGDSWYIEKD